MRSVSDQPAVASRCYPRFTSILLRLLLPCSVIELVSRLAGYVVDVIRFDQGIYAEAMVRARLLNIRHGFRAKDIGRHVILAGADRIMLEEGVSLHHGVIIQTGVEGYCRIGAHTHISHGSVLAAGSGIEIGRDCAFSSGLAIYSVTNTRPDATPLASCPLLMAPVSIGEGVLIGANAMVMPGVTICDGGVVGAGAVVCSDVPGNSVAIGVPARVTRNLA